MLYLLEMRSHSPLDNNLGGHNSEEEEEENVPLCWELSGSCLVSWAAA